VLGLEGEAAVLLGVLLVEAPQVGQLLDHLGVEQAAAGRRVPAADVGLEDLREAILKGFHQRGVLHAGAIYGIPRRQGDSLPSSGKVTFLGTSASPQPESGR